MRKRKIYALLLLMVCFLLCSAGIQARAEAQSAQESYQVADVGELLTDSEKSKLETQVEELELLTNWDVMLLTITDAEGKTANHYAESWFDEYTSQENGVICLIDMDNREMVIKSCGEAIPYLTDARIEEILDAAYYSISDGEYFDTFKEMLAGISKAYQRGIPDDTEIYDEDTNEVIGYYTKKKKITPLEAVIAVVAALAAGGITFGVVVGKYRLKWGGYQYSYREKGQVELSGNHDVFVNQIVTHRVIPKNDSGSEGGKNRSTTHEGAGGRRYGGGSRKF